MSCHLDVAVLTMVWSVGAIDNLCDNITISQIHKSGQSEPRHPDVTLGINGTTQTQFSHFLLLNWISAFLDLYENIWIPLTWKVVRKSGRIRKAQKASISRFPKKIWILSIMSRTPSGVLLLWLHCQRGIYALKPQKTRRFGRKKTSIWECRISKKEIINKSQ